MGAFSLARRAQYLRTVREGFEDLFVIFEKLCFEKIEKVYCPCKGRNSFRLRSVF